MLEIVATRRFRFGKLTLRVILGPKLKLSKIIGNSIKQTNVKCPFKKLWAKNKIFGKLTSNS